MCVVGTGNWWAVCGAVLTAEHREHLKGSKDATPLGLQRTKVLSLKNLVTKTYREKVECIVFSTKWKRTPTNKKTPSTITKQQLPQNLVSSSRQRELLLDGLAKHKLHLCWSRCLSRWWGEAKVGLQGESLEELGLFSLSKMVGGIYEYSANMSAGKQCGGEEIFNTKGTCGQQYRLLYLGWGNIVWELKKYFEPLVWWSFQAE